MGRVLLLFVLAACPSRGGEKKPPADDKWEAKPLVEPVKPPVPAKPTFEIAAPSDPVVDIGRGERHACVVRASGAVDCWGQHRVCVKDCIVPLPADGSVRRVPGVTDAVAIGGDGRCVVRKTGEVACLSNDTLELVAIAGLKDVKAVDNASECFIQTSGAVWCLDDDRKKPIAVGVKDAVAVSSSLVLSCALRRSGDIWCGRTDRAFAKLLDVPKAKELVVGWTNYVGWLCLVAVTGKASCYEVSSYWERRFAPEKEREDARSALAHPERFHNATQLTFRHVGTGEGSYSVLEAIVDNKVVRYDPRDSDAAEAVPLLADPKKLVSGCAIRAQGSVVCWGDNRGGVLAQPTTIDRLDAPASTVVGLADVVDLAVGTKASYALTRTGEVFRWGEPENWRAVGATVPEPMKLGLGPHDLVEIAADRDNRVCMRSKTGEVWCQRESPRLNDRHLEQLDTENVVSMSMGEQAVYLVHGDGSAESFVTERDYGRDGMLDADVELDAPVIGSTGAWDYRCWMTREHSITCPKKIVGLDGATAMAAGSTFVCGIVRGKVACSTVRYDEQNIQHDNPGIVEIAGIHDATDIAASYEYACAVHAGGKIGCFHFDDKGMPSTVVEVLDRDAVDVELGHGRADQIRESRQLHGPVPAGETGCAIMRDYTVKCWGTNLAGETGDGSFVESESPIGVKL